MADFVVIDRDQHSRNFTVLSNHILRDTNISYHARYLMSWLLSYTPKQDFKYTLEMIARKTEMPLTRVRSSIQELQDAGYLELKRTRNGARYGHYMWHLYETPIKAVDSEPVQDKDIPAAAEIITTEQFNFEQFWNKYPKKVNYDKARKAFLSISNINTVFPDMMRALEVQINSNQWREEGGRYIPDPENYIKKSGWNITVNNYSDDEMTEFMEGLVK